MARPTILGPDGRPVRLETDPLPQPDSWSGFHLGPQRLTQGLTPQGITGILAEADDGFPQRQAELFEDAIGKSGHLFGVYRTRVMAPAKLPWDVQPATADAADRRVADWLRGKLQALSLRAPLRRLMSGVAYGYAAEQIVWAQSPGDVDVVELRAWPTRYLLPDATGQIRRISTAMDPTGVDMPPARFVVHSPAEEASDPVAAGLMRTATWYWYFANWGVKAWLAYIEVYGQPLRIGKYDPGTSPEDRAVALDTLQRMGRDAVALLPRSVQVEIVEMTRSGSSSDLHERLVQRCDQELSILFLGQTLTTAVGQTGGAFAAAQVHDQVRHDLLEWDAAQLAETVQRDLVSPWVGFRWGRDVDLPRLVFRCEPPEDLEARSRTLKTLVTDMGLPVAHRWLYDRFGIPAPVEGEDVVEGPPAPSQAPQAVPARRGTAEAVAAARDRGKAVRPVGMEPLPADRMTWTV